MRVEISPFADEYLEGCARLFAGVFSREPWNEPWTLETARRRVREITSFPGSLGFVALLDGEVVGLALGGLWQEAEGRLFYLYEMCVKPEEQGTGVGGSLLGRLSEELESVGVEKIFLLTARDTPAEAFYERHGFRRDSRVTAMFRGT